MEKLDTVDANGNPVCIVTYRSGLTENGFMFDGRCANYSDDEIRRVINGPGNDKPYPMSNRDLVDCYFSKAFYASLLKLCETVLADAGGS